MAFPTTQDGGQREDATTGTAGCPGDTAPRHPPGNTGRSWPLARTAKASSRGSGCPSPTRHGCSGSPRRGLRKRSRERSDHQSTESTTSRIRKLSRVELKPADTKVKPGDKLSFGVRCFDQHGQDYPCPAVVWSSSGGQVDQKGLYVAE